MKMSDIGFAFVMHEEGFVGHVYGDQAELGTIGYGHLIRPGETYTTLTEPEARELLLRDIAGAEHAVTTLVRPSLEQVQFDAVASGVFNIGVGRFAHSQWLAKLNSGDVGDYSGGDRHKLESYSGSLREWAEFRMIEKDGKKVVCDDLVARRAREIAMFLSELPALPARPYSPNVQHAAGERDPDDVG